MLDGILTPAFLQAACAKAQQQQEPENPDSEEQQEPGGE